MLPKLWTEFQNAPQAKNRAFCLLTPPSHTQFCTLSSFWTLKLTKNGHGAPPMTIFKGLLVQLLKTNFPSMRDQKKKRKSIGKSN